MTEPTGQHGEEIREGDDVVHRESGKRGKVMRLLSAGIYWQLAPEGSVPLDWAVVWWRGEAKPAVDAVTDVTKRA